MPIALSNLSIVVLLFGKLTKLLGIWYISDFGIVVNIRMEMKFDESNVDISITTNQK